MTTFCIELLPLQVFRLDGVSQQNYFVVYRFVKVGNYDGSTFLEQQLQIKRNSIIWTRGDSQVGNVHFVSFLHSLRIQK